MGSLTPERSMSLNLDSWLTGLGVEPSNLEEMLNVNETFFDAYVQELEGQAPSYQGIHGKIVHPANQAPVNPTAGPLPLPAALAAFPAPVLSTIGVQAPVPMSGIQSFAPGLVQLFPQHVAQPALQPLSSSSFTLQGSTGLAPSVTTGLPDQDRTSQERFPQSQQDHISPPRQEHGSNSGGGDSGGDNYVEIEEIDSNGRKKKRRIRTPKQQVLNKLAQQRYRERRKAKYSEMESTVDALVDQLGKLQTVEKQNKELSKQNEDMGKQLKEQQEQLKFLQQQLSLSTQAAAQAAVENGIPAGNLNDRSAPPDFDALRTKLGNLITNMRAILTQHQMDDKLDDNLQQLPEVVVRDLAAAVADSCTLCMKLFLSNTPLVTQALSSDLGRFHDVKCPHAKAAWTKALTNLNLSKAQEDMLLELRGSHLKNLHSLYDERNRLNMQAMAFMLPRPHQDPSPEGQVQSRTVYGQACAIKHDTALNEALDKLKANLRQEQRGFMEMNYHLMHKVLTPVQSAKLLVEAYPHNIDALALSNCLAVKEGLQPQPPMPPAGECGRGAQSNFLTTGVKTELPQTAQPAA